MDFVNDKKTALIAPEVTICLGGIIFYRIPSKMFLEVSHRDKDR